MGLFLVECRSYVVQTLKTRITALIIIIINHTTVKCKYHTRRSDSLESVFTARQEIIAYMCRDDERRLVIRVCFVECKFGLNFVRKSGSDCGVLTDTTPLRTIFPEKR